MVVRPFERIVIGDDEPDRSNLRGESQRAGNDLVIRRRTSILSSLASLGCFWKYSTVWRVVRPYNLHGPSHQYAGVESARVRWTYMQAMNISKNIPPITLSARVDIAPRLSQAVRSVSDEFHTALPLPAAV